MMAHPAALYLTHFDTPPVTAPALDLAPASDVALLWDPPEPAEDREALLTAAREEGRVEGIETGRAEAALQAEAMRKAFDEQLAAERQKWLDAESELLKTQVANGLDQMKGSLADCVGQILRPFVIELLRRQMLDELLEHVATLAAAHEAIDMVITAPADLIGVLRNKLADLPLAVRYEPSELVDVSVTAGQTTIETRLKAWIDLIGAKLE